mmetsp:Transcript_16446/g.45571  ORF Transcript_16446/g.45571 Transcript_16446/m.45571 type:complete len:226 (+) Transcript_16446:325-1002(+)
MASFRRSQNPRSVTYAAQPSVPTSLFVLGGVYAVHGVNEGRHVHVARKFQQHLASLLQTVLAIIRSDLEDLVELGVGDVGLPKLGVLQDGADLHGAEDDVDDDGGGLDRWVDLAELGEAALVLVELQELPHEFGNVERRLGIAGLLAELLEPGMPDREEVLHLRDGIHDTALEHIEAFRIHGRNNRRIIKAQLQSPGRWVGGGTKSVEVLADETSRSRKKAGVGG